MMSGLASRFLRACSKVRVIPKVQSYRPFLPTRCIVSRSISARYYSSTKLEINLAGSVNPELDETEEDLPEKKEETPALESHPDIRIRLVKPSGRSVIFNCSLPTRDLRDTVDSESTNVPTYSVDSVEMERLPGYFVYTDLFDDNMYDHTMQMLMERQLDANFQNQLQEFCTGEEHKLYLKFLDEFHAYCRD